MRNESRMRAAVADERSALLRDPPTCLVSCGDILEASTLDGVIGDPPSHHLDVVVRNARCAVPAVRVRLLLSERWCRPATRSRSESEVRQYVECKDAGADVRPCSVRVFVLSILINSNVDDQSKGELVVHFFLMPCHRAYAWRLFSPFAFASLPPPGAHKSDAHHRGLGSFLRCPRALRRSWVTKCALPHRFIA